MKVNCRSPIRKFLGKAVLTFPIQSCKQNVIVIYTLVANVIYLLYIILSLVLFVILKQTSQMYFHFHACANFVHFPNLRYLM